ncbi:MAG: hypothetical protein MZV70_62650 [Desulfobacterales bacterium]|nr:hypothetical protein [Desulfobacterales bacterium]
MPGSTLAQGYRTGFPGGSSSPDWCRAPVAARGCAIGLYGGGRGGGLIQSSFARFHRGIHGVGAAVWATARRPIRPAVPLKLSSGDYYTDPLENHRSTGEVFRGVRRRRARDAGRAAGLAPERGGISDKCHALRRRAPDPQAGRSVP